MSNSVSSREQNQVLIWSQPKPVSLYIAQTWSSPDISDPLQPECDPTLCLLGCVCWFLYWQFMTGRNLRSGILGGVQWNNSPIITCSLPSIIDKTVTAIYMILVFSQTCALLLIGKIHSLNSQVRQLIAREFRREPNCSSVFLYFLSIFAIGTFLISDDGS